MGYRASSTLIYGVQVPNKRTRQVRGCKHEILVTSKGITKFCPECGKPHSETYTWGATAWSEDLIQDFNKQNPRIEIECLEPHAEADFAYIGYKLGTAETDRPISVHTIDLMGVLLSEEFNSKLLECFGGDLGLWILLEESY